MHSGDPFTDRAEATGATSAGPTARMKAAMAYQILSVLEGKECQVLSGVCLMEMTQPLSRTVVPPGKSTPHVYPGERKIMFTHKTCPKMFSPFLINSPKLETAQHSTGEEFNGHAPRPGVLFSNKKEQTKIHATSTELQGIKLN